MEREERQAQMESEFDDVPGCFAVRLGEDEEMVSGGARRRQATCVYVAG